MCPDAPDADATSTEVYVCTNIDCRSRGADLVLEALRAELGAGVRPYLCFSACNSGPNVVIPQRRCWLSAVRPDDAAVVCDVVRGADPPDRLQAQNDPDLQVLILGLIDAGLLVPEEGA